VTPSSTAARATGRWRALAVLLTLVGVGCLLLWSDRSTSPVSPAAADSRPTGSTLSPAASGQPATDVLARPVGLRIPAIDVKTLLTRLGLQPDGTVEVPDEPAVAGWYRLGPTPGAMGSAVILGHVDSATGPAVFYRLSQLGVGDRVVVRLDNGSSAEFRVSSVRTYANELFPARKVYAPHGRRELNLVTCGGVYDAQRGGYQSNVVVNSRRTG
jgi:sortase (surface protein transpeptidase)